MRILFALSLLMMGTAGCGSRTQVVYPGSAAYEARLRGLGVSPERAAQLLRERGVWGSGPLALVDRWYLFGKPYKYARIDLEGYYVSGESGVVEYRGSDRRLERGWLGWPVRLPYGAYGADRFVKQADHLAGALGRFELSDDVEAVGVCEQGHRFAAAKKDHKIVVADVETGRVVQEMEWEGGDCERLSFSRDGEVLFCYEGNGLFNSRGHCEVWRVKDGRLLFSNEPKSGAAVFGDQELPQLFVNTGVLSPDGRMLMLSAHPSDDPGPDAYTLAAGERPRPVRIRTDGQGVLLALGFSRDGGKMVCVAVPPQGDFQTRYVILNTSDYHVMASRTVEGLRFAGFGGDRAILGKLPVGDERSNIEISDLEGGKVLGAIEPPTGPLVGAGFLGRGRWFAMLGEHELVVREVASGSVVLQENTIGNGRGDLAVDGDTVAIGDGRKGVQVWRIRSDPRRSDDIQQ